MNAMLDYSLSALRGQCEDRMLCPIPDCVTGSTLERGDQDVADVLVPLPGDPRDVPPGHAGAGQVTDLGRRGNARVVSGLDVLGQLRGRCGLICHGTYSWFVGWIRRTEPPFFLCSYYRASRWSNQR